MKVTSNILNEHAQNYIRDVMADQLRKDGFVSRNGMDIHWYRIINGNLLQAVLFNTRHAALPMFLDIAYSCHPLFIAPEYPKGVYISSMLRSREAVHPWRPILKATNNTLYSQYVSVACPNDSYQGADILADVLSLLNGITNIEECYSLHKSRYFTIAELENMPVKEIFINTLSVDFMDEIVYFDDKELYPFCKSRIVDELQRYDKAQTVRKLWNIEKYEMDSLLHLDKAIICNQRDEHLIYLEGRQVNNIAQLKKKVKGIL